MSAPVLSVRLTPVLSWSRPRPGRGRVRYTGAYADGREGWALLVRHAATAQGWAAPEKTARLHVTVRVTNGGKRDLDRVCTAVLDALQGGGAIADDCLCDGLHAERVWVPKVEPRVEVSVLRLADAVRGVWTRSEGGVPVEWWYGRERG
jgi:hypothetical protein